MTFNFNKKSVLLILFGTALVLLITNLVLNSLTHAFNTDENGEINIISKKNNEKIIPLRGKAVQVLKKIL